MGGWTTALQGIGRVGSDVATGSELLRKQRQEDAEAALRKLQLQMQNSEFQQRVKEYQDKQPANVIKAIENVVGPLSREEKERLLGFAPPIASVYTATRPSANGMEGLNRLTGVWEKIPGSDSYKPPVKTPTPRQVDPIIVAQIGKPPDASKFPLGEDDPGFKRMSKLWGDKAEQLIERRANVVAETRGRAFGQYRYSAYVTPDGTLVTAPAGEAAAKGYIPATAAFNVMPKQAQFQEMQAASAKLRGIINDLQPGDAFTPAATIEMYRAMMAPDTGALSASINNLMASGLNDRQQDFVVWLSQMKERILTLRNIAGMGQGAEDLRAAIQATIPNIASGNKELALKRLDAIDNQIRLLYPGIAKMPKGSITNLGGTKVSGDGSSQDKAVVLP